MSPLSWRSIPLDYAAAAMRWRKVLCFSVLWLVFVFQCSASFRLCDYHSPLVLYPLLQVGSLSWIYWQPVWVKRCLAWFYVVLTERGKWVAGNFQLVGRCSTEWTWHWALQSSDACISATTLSVCRSNPEKAVPQFLALLTSSVNICSYGSTRCFVCSWQLQ